MNKEHHFEKKIRIALSLAAMCLFIFTARAQSSDAISDIEIQYIQGNVEITQSDSAVKPQVSFRIKDTQSVSRYQVVIKKSNGDTVATENFSVADALNTRKNKLKLKDNSGVYTIDCDDLPYDNYNIDVIAQDKDRKNLTKKEFK